MAIYTHKIHQWTREHLGRDEWRIVPTDDSGVRVVSFMGRHCWANLPNDDKAKQDQDRVVLVSGDPLPAWAQTWLENVNRRQCENGRARLQAAMDDADWHASRNDGW